MTLDSDNIRFMRIFAEVPWKGASYNSGEIENVFFRGFGRYVFGTLGNEAKHYYIVLFSPLSAFHWFTCDSTAFLLHILLLLLMFSFFCLLF